MDKSGPCKEKNCWRCCDPVKVTKWTEVPKDENGFIRAKRDEMRIPEKHPDSIRLEIYDCLRYDGNKKHCLNYENRPSICRNTTCINDEGWDINKQYENLTNETFYILFPKSWKKE